MAAKRPLNIGLVGCGFMGRAHSNAWSKVNNFFDLEYQPVLRAVCARNPDEVQGFAEQWGYASTETDWRALVARDDIDLIDIASPNDTHAEIAVAAAAAGKMVTTEKPLARGGAESERMVEAVEARRRAEHGLVQLPSRPGRDAGQAAHRRGAAGENLPLPRQVPAGLDDLQRSPAGRRGAVAARRERGRQWRHRRSPGALHRHRPLAQRRHRPRLGHDRDLHHRAPAHADRESRTGRHRRRQRLPGALRQWLPRHLRGDPLRPRSQGALHPGDQWRARLDRLGSARSAPVVVLRSRRRGAGARLALHPHHRRRPPLHGALVGAGFVHRLRALLRPPGRRFPDRPGVRRGDYTHIPRGAGDGLRHRRGAEIGEIGEVGDA